MRDNGKESAFILTSQQRDRLLAGENPSDVLPHDYNLACHRDVWDYRNPLGEESCRDVPAILSEDRGESCFFFRFTPGMFFPSAVELERRQADHREAEKDRRLTRRAFWVAFVALVTSILASLAQILVQVLSR